MTRHHAEEALALAKADPERALELAKTLAFSKDADVVNIALWAQGNALYELGRNSEAMHALKRAVDSSPQDRRGRMEVSLAAAEAAAGDTEVARARLHRLSDHDDPVVVALAVSQLGTTALHSGDLHEALKLSRSALPTLMAADDEQPALARVLGNIGHCLLLLDRVRESIIYTSAALRIAEQTAQMTVVAGSLQNIGYAEMKLGNLPVAIDQLERAREVYAQIGDHGRNLVTLYDDLAETYRFAGLMNESMRFVSLARLEVKSGSNLEKRADAEFRRAVCLLDGGEASAALAAASWAADAYLSSDRPVQARRAQVVALDAQFETGAEQPVMSASDITAASRQLAEAGWSVEAAALRNHAARIAMDSGLTDQATRLLAGDPVTSSETVTARLEACYGDALRCRHRPDEFSRSLQQARTVLHVHRVRLSDPELRAGAARLSERFRRLDVADALATESPEAVVLAEERWRAFSLRTPRPIPQYGPAAQPLVEELRAVSHAAVASAAPDDDIAPRISDLEERIRIASFSDATSGESSEFEDLEVDALRADIGTRQFVEIVAHEREVFAVTVGPGASGGLRHCGTGASISQRTRRLQRTMARLLRPGLSHQAAGRAADSAKSDARQLAEHLFSDLESSDELVVSPPPEMLELPWSLIGREVAGTVVVTPSASIWLRPRDMAVGDRSAILCGPELAHAHRDVRAMSSAFEDCLVRDGDRATSSELRRLLESVSLLHISAHGAFRADSPRFSSLQLADGPVMMYEFDLLRHSPALVVLGSCDAGRSVGLAGGESLGAASALLSAGTSCVVAPVYPIPDDEAATAFEAFYGSLVGRFPQQALETVREGAEDAHPRMWATAHSLQCIGGAPPHVSLTAPEPLEECDIRASDHSDVENSSCGR